MEDLAIKNQIVYTTHSPFMLNRDYPHRVRLVSKDKDGTCVDSEAYRENWRPLRSSIGLMIGDLFFFNDSGMMLELPSRKMPFYANSIAPATKATATAIKAKLCPVFRKNPPK